MKQKRKEKQSQRKGTDRIQKKEEKIEEKTTVKSLQFERRNTCGETEITSFEGKPLFLIMNICILFTNS